MRPESIRIFEWIGKYREKARFDLSRNELYQQDLEALGVETSYSHYLSEPDPDSYFRSTVAELYHVDPENVIPTIGGTESIFLSSAFMGNISRRIVIPVPEYEPIFRVPQALGYNIAFSPGKKLLETVGNNDSVMMTTPSNPEGLNQSITVSHLLNALGENSRIYADETFTEFMFNDRPETVFHLDSRIFTSGTMTKFFGLTKLRTGWILSHQEDQKSLGRIKSMTSAANPKYPLWLAANALRERKKFAAIVGNMLKKNLPVANRFVSEFDYLNWKKPDSAPFGFVRYDMDIDSVSLCRKIFYDTGILLVPGAFLGEENGFRLCFFLNPEEAAQAFDVLTQYFAEHDFKGAH